MTEIIKLPVPDRKANNASISEDAAALEFARDHAGQMLFCHDAASWYEWAGTHWRPERTGLAFEWARQLARRLGDSEDPRVRATVGKTSFASGVERFCRSDRTFAVRSDKWDANPYLLGTPGGTVDLTTGEVIPSNPAHFITRITAVAPSDKASCQLWMKFLDEATLGDKELQHFIQQYCGYCLTGDTREHALVFIYGDGGNGKGVFLNTISRIILDYATTAAMDTFTATHGDKHPTDLAMLRGSRLVSASETEEGRPWAEARIKAMTGGDPITARFMRQDFFTFLPNFKLIIAGNHKPTLQTVDDAARRRFNLIPFIHRPPMKDAELPEKLEAEWPAILRWMIDGCLDWQANGLVRPDIVKATTDTYFEEQDLLGQWLADECIADVGNPYRSAPGAELFYSWKRYAENAGDTPGSQRSFSDRLERRGFQRKRTNKSREIVGLELKRQPSFHDDR